MNTMRENTQICPKCETGKKDYELDKNSLFCSHINCLKDGICSKFIPLLFTENRQGENAQMV